MLSIGKVCTVLLLFSGLVCGCPTWYTNISGHCECGVTIGERIKCHTDEERVDIRAGYCMTFDYKMKSALSGSCPYGYIHSNMTNRVYAALPRDPTQLNETTCGPYYREGLLCAHCIEGFGPAIYISDLACVNCSDISRGSAIILYLVLEFVPITLFYFVVVVLHLNITSGPILGYILFCQIRALLDMYYSFMLNSIQSHLPHYLATLHRISTVLSEVWSLNFWGALPPFCLSDRITGIHLRMLSFVTAVYVVILMATTCTGIELHKRNYRVVRCLWKPFGLCFLVFQKQWSASDSVIHAFATFIMLSSFTLTFDTLSLFHFTVVRNVNGIDVKHVLYCDPSIVTYSTEHIVYLGAAIIIFFLLAVCPALLLCLYPTRVYEKLSRCCSPRTRLAAKIFAEALHDCFKNGLNGTRDYRSLAGVVVTAPVPCVILGSLAKLFLPLPLYTSVIAVMFLFISFSISYIRPCKSLIMNASLSFHSTLLGIMCFEYALWMEGSSLSSDVLAQAFVVLPAVSHCLILIWAGYKFICFSHCGYHLMKCLLRRAALSLSRKRDYEELCDTLMHNQ